MNWVSYAKSKWEILAGRLAVFLMFKEVIGDTLFTIIIIGKCTEHSVLTFQILRFETRLPRTDTEACKPQKARGGFIRLFENRHNNLSLEDIIPLVMQTETERQSYYRVNCALPYGVL